MPHLKKTTPNFMQHALKEARKAAKADEVPVGAVLVHEGRIIAKSHNQTRGSLNLPPDPTAHAELTAIRLGCAALDTERLSNCDLYVTLEPCTMCAASISFARIRRLYYGAPDEKGGAVEHGVRFFNSKNCFHTPELYPNLSEQESEILLKDFFRKKRL